MGVLYAAAEHGVMVKKDSSKPKGIRLTSGCLMMMMMTMIWVTFKGRDMIYDNTTQHTAVVDSNNVVLFFHVVQCLPVGVTLSAGVVVSMATLTLAAELSSVIIALSACAYHTCHVTTLMTDHTGDNVAS